MPGHFHLTDFKRLLQLLEALPCNQKRGLIHMQQLLKVCCNPSRDADAKFIVSKHMLQLAFLLCKPWLPVYCDIDSGDS